MKSVRRYHEDEECQFEKLEFCSFPGFFDAGKGHRLPFVAYDRMIGWSKVSPDRFRCVFLIF